MCNIVFPSPDSVDGTWGANGGIVDSDALSVSSSEGSFVAEVDFASAVTRAAELSGLTVVGSVVSQDPNSDVNSQKGGHYICIIILKSKFFKRLTKGRMTVFWLSCNSKEACKASPASAATH